METNKAWEIIEFVENKFVPKVVRRNSDSELFRLGDHVTNGTKMNGLIEKFDMCEGNLYVYTDWSGIGMGFEDIKRVESPGLLSEGQVVNFELPTTVKFGNVIYANEEAVDKAITGTPTVVLISATVRGVHLYKGAVKYDLDIWLHGNSSTRIYNVDSNFVKKA